MTEKESPRRLRPGDRVAGIPGGGAAMGVRQDGSWCWQALEHPHGCGGGRRSGLALCPDCAAAMLGRACPNCGHERR